MNAESGGAASAARGALRGVRVVDLSSVLLGPYCTHHLGDMGADVIKVEAPEGDSTRYLGPSRSQGMGGVFLHVNRNKRSIAVDLKRPEGRDVVMTLARGADVLVTNMRQAALERLRLDYEQVRRCNDRLVYCHAVGYSSSGPYAEEPAFDDTIQALTGMTSLQGLSSGRPQYVASVIADKVTGLMAAFAIAAALHDRGRTGRGQKVDVPMFETMVSFTLAEHLFGHAFEPPLAPPVYPRVASQYRRPYRTKDGYIAILPYLDSQWRRFFAAAGCPEAADDERFVSIAARTRHIDELYCMVDGMMTGHTTAEWLALLREQDIPAVPINETVDLFDDPHLVATGFFQHDEHPSEGPVLSMKPPVEMTESPASIRRLAPRLGEHTRELLEEAGYGAPQVAELYRQGVVR